MTSAGSVRNNALWGDGWRAHAACRHEDPELFFPVGVTGAALPQIAAAKAVCTGCPVREACLAFALTTNQDYGVWGGLDEEERREERRRWRREAKRRTRHPVAS
jgi:WhiB family transcriptional regulator, redox-sensing transcriptional regulator